MPEKHFVELPADLKIAESKPKTKDKKAMAEAQAFAKFGVQTLRVKSHVLAALGKEASRCGIKAIGHGRIIVASENAEAAIARLGVVVDEMIKKGNPDFEVLLDIMRLQKEFNAQLIRTAEAHFSADKQPMAPPAAGGSLTLPFPSGTPVLITPMEKEDPSKP